MIKRYYSKLDEDKKELINKSSISLIMRLVGFMINYVFLFVCTHFYGFDGWGGFSIGFSVIQIASMLSNLGINISLIKLASNPNFSIKHIFKTVLQWFIPVVIGISIIVFFGVELFENHIHRTTIYQIKIASIGILPFSLSLLVGGILRGKKKIVAFSFFDSLGRTLFSLLILVLFIFIDLENGQVIIISFVLGQYLLCGTALFFLQKIFRDEVIASDQKIKIDISNVLKLSLPMFWSGIMSNATIYIVILFLGFQFSENIVGQFDSVYKISSLMMLIPFAINSVSATRFAETSNDIQELSKNVFNASQISFFSSILLFTFLILFQETIFGLLHIPNSTDNFVLLTLLLISQLCINFSGSVGFLMQMVGFEKKLRDVSIFSIIFVLASLYLIQILLPASVIYIAILITLNEFIKNFVCVWYVKVKTGISTFYLIS